MIAAVIMIHLVLVVFSQVMIMILAMTIIMMIPLTMLRKGFLTIIIMGDIALSIIRMIPLAMITKGSSFRKFVLNRNCVQKVMVILAMKVIITLIMESSLIEAVIVLQMMISHIMMKSNLFLPTLQQ
jgi:hypothetical protein